MKAGKRKNYCFSLLFLLLIFRMAQPACAEEISPSPYWKNQIAFPEDPFQSKGLAENEPAWVKFTILRLDGYDPNIVYFQDCNQYPFHYEFATELLDPFIGLSQSEFYDLCLYEAGQQAILGAVILPPLSGEPPAPDFNEYGIQFIRKDPYSKEEIAALFNLVKDCVPAAPDVNVFYFPTYEQLSTARKNEEWLKSHGVIVGSPARWSTGNVCYSQGWALGELKFVPADEIDLAYQNGDLLAGDILLTDGIPAEIPFVSGIITTAPTTPNSHVAILAQTFAAPFTYLAVTEDVNKAQQLIGKCIFLFVGNEDGICYVGLKDVEGILTEEEKQTILAMKEPLPLDIQPIQNCGSLWADTNGLLPTDIKYFGGKAANYGILRQSIEANSPAAFTFSFNLWNQFLDQPIQTVPQIILSPGQHLLIWADDDTEQGPTHTDFKLSREGEAVALFDIDGTTLIDKFSFGPQSADISYGRTIDGGDNWQFFTSPTPGWSNSGTSDGNSLVINEFMADNQTTIQDPNEPGEFADWIELYNGSDAAITLNGMYLTDDVNDPTKYQIPVAVTKSTLREEIEYRLSKYTTYPPADLKGLYEDLAAIRSMFKNAYITNFNPELESAVISAIEDFGLDSFEKIRFRSSTNVEDTEKFTGAGLYDSYSGCLADDLDGDDAGPCACDATETGERGVFRAIRKVFASFYNDNAFLERLRHDVNEGDVGMALLVHHSFPDQLELANGVATVEKKQDDPNFYIKLVTQNGAVPVTNPEDGSIPEVVNIVYSSVNDINSSLIQSSNLVIIGQTVLDWRDDYNNLSQLLVTAANQFSQVTGKTEYMLDLEYKKVSPGGAAKPAGGLEVDQIRQIPSSEQSPTEYTPLLLNEPLTLCIPEYDVLLDPARKSNWTFETKNIWLTSENLKNTFLDKVTIEYAADGRSRKIAGKFGELPYHSHTFAGTTATDSFTMHHLSSPRTYMLTIKNIPTSINPSNSPIVTLGDICYKSSNKKHELSLKVNSNTIQLKTPYSTLPSHQSFSKSQKTISTYFYKAEDMVGLAWSMGRFHHTTITGYTSQQIYLSSILSQYHLATIHNWYDKYIFIPQLEPGISQAILDELKDQNIGQIIVTMNIQSYYISTAPYIEPYYNTDIDGDGDTNMKDYAQIALRWLDSACDDCGGADLTGDGRVDMEDIRELTLNWLDGTSP